MGPPKRQPRYSGHDLHGAMIRGCGSPHHRLTHEQRQRLPRLPSRNALYSKVSVGGNPRPGDSITSHLPQINQPPPSFPRRASPLCRRGGNPRPRLNNQQPPLDTAYPNPSYKSTHDGFPSSIRRTFQALRHFLIALSRSIALSIDSCTSYHTNRWTSYFPVKTLPTSFLCCHTRCTRLEVTPI